jgi:hypothetical protein
MRSFNNIEMWAVIKYFFLQGKAPKEIHIILTETLWEHAPSYTTVKTGCPSLNMVIFPLVDAPRPGRPKTVSTPLIIDHIHKLRLEDHRILAKSIAEQLGIPRWVLHSNWCRGNTKKKIYNKILPVVGGMVVLYALFSYLTAMSTAQPWWPTCVFNPLFRSPAQAHVLEFKSLPYLSGRLQHTSVHALSPKYIYMIHGYNWG